jgi:C_GCAxxG_C_C family probable redox protein
MIRKQAEERALNYFRSGFHCAESISKAIVELFSDEPSSEIPRVATGFGGGMGGSHEEACGALTGGILAIGYLYGRSDPNAGKDDAFKLVAEFRKRFLEEVGSTGCKNILDQLGKQDNYDKCKKMTAVTAGILAEILSAHTSEKADKPA